MAGALTALIMVHSGMRISSCLLCQPIHLFVLSPRDFLYVEVTKEAALLTHLLEVFFQLLTLGGELFYNLGIGLYFNFVAPSSLATNILASSALYSTSILVILKVSFIT